MIHKFFLKCFSVYSLLRVVENRVLRRIFVPKRDEVKIRLVQTLREMRNVCNNLVGKCGQKRPLRRLRHRCEDNVKMKFREIG
jgi:hypothetical protein